MYNKKISLLLWSCWFSEYKLHENLESKKIRKTPTGRETCKEKTYGENMYYRIVLEKKRI
jgi:hypothetical protein